MRLLSKLKDALTQPSLDDTHLYAQVASETERGYRREGLWAKALTEVEFDTQRAKAVYMKMAVAALKQEAREAAKAHENAEADAMRNAFSLYNSGQFSAAQHGLFLLAQRKQDASAMVCLGHISWHGLSGEFPDRNTASKFFDAAELSSNSDARRLLGQILEPLDWERALLNYDFAAKAGNEDAKQLSRDLRTRLKAHGVIKKTLWDRLSS